MQVFLGSYLPLYISLKSNVCHKKDFLFWLHKRCGRSRPTKKSAPAQPNKWWLQAAPQRCLPGNARQCRLHYRYFAQYT